MVQRGGVGPDVAARPGFASHETAWAWMHNLRRAMFRPGRDLLTGTVKLDETTVGGRSKGRPGAGSAKVPVMVAVEVEPGRKRSGASAWNRPPRRSSDQLLELATWVIATGSRIRTDGACNLRRLSERGYTHEYAVITSPHPPTSTNPSSTSSRPCSNAGSPAPCTTASPDGTWTTTSTSSPLGSTAGRGLTRPRRALLPAPPTVPRHRLQPLKTLIGGRKTT